MRGQQFRVDETHAARQFIDRVVQLFGRHGIEYQADADCFMAAQVVAGHQHALSPLRTDVIDPHLNGRGAVGACGGKTDLGVFGTDDEITHQSQIGAAGQAVALNLGDDRLVHVEQHHIQLLGLFQIPAIVIDRFVCRAITGLIPRRGAIGKACVRACEVVACTEVLASAFQNDHIHIITVIGLEQGVT
ncbi:hypothetical protein D3C78_1108820 [compost metagenome]